MINYIPKVIFLSAILLIGNVHANVHEFETTHMKSMGGAGIAGILAEESAFNNPAPLAFFTTSSVYAQKDKSALGSATGFVLADGNPEISGSISYVKQEEDDFRRSRWGLSMSTPTSKNSSAGVSIRKTTDDKISSHTSTKYYQAVLGVDHIISEQFSVGVVAYDPFKSKGGETKAMIGMQYLLMDYIVGVVDFGGNYTKDTFSKSLIYKGALQVTVLNDVFLRVGTFTDKEKSEKGTGMGLAWIQPRLSFAFAQKNFTTSMERRIKESSLSLSLRF
jgi:hypothetical protein